MLLAYKKYKCVQCKKNRPCCSDECYSSDYIVYFLKELTDAIKKYESDSYVLLKKYIFDLYHCIQNKDFKNDYKHLELCFSQFMHVIYHTDIFEDNIVRDLVFRMMKILELFIERLAKNSNMES